MDQTRFDQAFKYLVGDEGLIYTNRANDSGGPTKCGVTLKAYESFVGRPVLPLEIENLPEDAIRSFYFLRYWEPLHCGEIVHTEIATALFDSGVLYGVGTAALLTQQVLNSFGAGLKFDGILGDKSLAALNQCKPEDFLQSFHGLLLQRIDSVIALDSKNEAFRKGWTSRADRLLTLLPNAPLNREVT